MHTKVSLQALVGRHTVKAILQLLKKISEHSLCCAQTAVEE